MARASYFGARWGWPIAPSRVEAWFPSNKEKLPAAIHQCGTLFLVQLLFLNINRRPAHLSVFPLPHIHR